jgi:hypothetical protein
MDAGLHLIETQFGEEVALAAAKRTEYRWNRNPDDDFVWK